MNELESLQNSAFKCARDIVEHIEKVVNEYMWKNNISLEDWRQNGGYSEKETLDGRACFLTYKKKVFHRFRYNAFGIITETNSLYK